MDIITGVKKFYEVAKIIITIFPTVVTAVKTVEDLLPGSGRGLEKLALVRAQLEAAYSVVGEFGISFTDFWPALELAITRLVAIFNSSGEFKP